MLVASGCKPLGRVGADVEGAMPPDFIQSGLPVRGEYLRLCLVRVGVQLEAARTIRRWRRHEMFQRPQDGIKQRGLVTVAKRRNRRLQRRLQLKPIMGGNDEVASR